MTTAKQQQPDKQPDSSDDLIAELGKLMAQDSRKDTERPAEVAPPPAPPPRQSHPEAVEQPAETFDLRLPDAPPQETFEAPAPRLDFTRSTPTAKPTPQEADAAPQAEDDNDIIGDLIAAELAGGSSQPQQLTPAQGALVEESREAAGQEGDDGFRISPVFGLDGPTESAFADSPSAGVSPSVDPTTVEPAPIAAATPRMRPAEAPAAPRDPKQDIESLIGSAAHVEAGTASPKPSPSPSLRSLATPVLPKDGTGGRASEATGPVAESAEEAILAAAAATGAQVDWIDPDEEDDVAAVPPRPGKRRRSLSRAMIGPAVAVGLLAIAGGGLYWVLGMGGDAGPPPVLSADAEPVKQEPEATTEEPTRESAVFNEIDGVTTPPEEETLVSRDQSLDDDISDIPPIADDDSGLVNRRVRTVTVRPDGTIVSSESGLAGTAALPVDRPNVPDVGDNSDSATATSTTEVANTDSNGAAGQDDASADEPVEDVDTVMSDGIGALLQSANAGGIESDTNEEPSAIASLGNDADSGALDADSTATPALEALVPGEPANVVNADGEPIPGMTAPVPMARLEQRSSAPIGPIQISEPSSPTNAVIETPSVDTATTPSQPAGEAAETTSPPRTLFGELFGNNEDTPAPTSSNAPAYVQLSAQRTEDAARQTANNLISRFGNLFQGRPLEVQRVDLEGQGVYYRVRLPAESATQASEICSSVQANGGDCFTL